MPAIVLEAQAEVAMHPIVVEVVACGIEMWVPTRKGRQVNLDLVLQFGELAPGKVDLAERGFLVDALGNKDAEAEQRCDGSSHQHADHGDHSIARAISPHRVPHHPSAVG